MIIMSTLFWVVFDPTDVVVSVMTKYKNGAIQILCMYIYFMT